MIHAAAKKKTNLDTYVTECLFGSQGKDAITHIITIVRNIRLMVKNIPEPTPDPAIKAMCIKLDKVRNQENNPDSQAYKRKLESMVDEEDMLAAGGLRKQVLYRNVLYYTKLH